MTGQRELAGGGPARVERVLDNLEAALHASTADWPGALPEVLPALAGWERLGRPHVLFVHAEHPGGALTRAWITPHLGAGWDGPPASAPPTDRAAAPNLGQALLPEPLLASLALADTADDLVVVAPEWLRSVSFPMLPLGPRQRLNSLAAVTQLPSLTWGAHLRERANRAIGHDVGPVADVVGFIDPTLGFWRLLDLLETSGVHRAGTLPAMRTHLAAARVQVAVIAAHGRLTEDGSVDLHDHAGNVVDPHQFRDWSLPEIVLIGGCRTGTCNCSAPLHLAEAALLAGAVHVVVCTEPTTDEVADRVLFNMLHRLGAQQHRRGLSPAQALQAALAQFTRAYPDTAAGSSHCSLIHLGLPGTARAPAMRRRT